MGNMEDALLELGRTIKADPKFDKAYATRGRKLYYLGRCEEAMRDLSVTLQIKPSHGDAKKLLPKAQACAKSEKMLAWAAERRDYTQLIVHAEVLLELADKKRALKLRAQLAEARYELGRYFESVADSGVVLKKPKDINMLLIRAKAYYKLADHEMALRHVKEALHFDPEHKQTKELFRTVKKLEKLRKRGAQRFNRARSRMRSRSTGRRFSSILLTTNSISIYTWVNANATPA